jgi:glycolate oxidase
VREVIERAVRAGGTITGEHGVGTLKLPFLPIEQAEPLLAAQRALKAAWDPHGILNPGKAIA